MPRQAGEEKGWEGEGRMRGGWVPASPVPYIPLGGRVHQGQGPGSDYRPSISPLHLGGGGSFCIHWC